MTLKTVKVPKNLEPLFQEAESFISDHFKSFKMRPETGQIFVGEDRYILVRAESLSVKFFEFLMNLYPTMDNAEAQESCAKVLFDLGRSIGVSDGQCCHDKTNSTDPLARLSTGPIHFAHTGWSFVEILEESSPTQDDDMLLLYNHPQTFESDSWIKTGTKTSFCTCHMNAGYSSGWVSEAFNIDLKSVEILCRSKGDSTCRFIMARPHKLEERILDYKMKNPDLFK